jgi:hypothetical protein
MKQVKIFIIPFRGQELCVKLIFKTTLAAYQYGIFRGSARFDSGPEWVSSRSRSPFYLLQCFKTKVAQLELQSWEQ